jgi:hypothetical protein
VPVPLAEHHDRRLHLDRELAHLEGREVLVLVEEVEQPGVAAGHELDLVLARRGVARRAHLDRRRLEGPAPAAVADVVRLPRTKATPCGHAGGLDDRAIVAHVVDELDVAVIEDRHDGMGALNHDADLLVYPLALYGSMGT